LNLDNRAEATLGLGFAVLACVSTFAQTSYNFQTINYPHDTFTQLLGLNISGEIAGYHNVNDNKGFTYELSTKKFTNENYPGSTATQVIGTVEEALYDSAVMRQFVGVDLGREPAPDETTVCKFRHLLEAHHLGEQILGRVNLHLQAQGVRITTGTIVDATILHCCSHQQPRCEGC
jgi:hypothetical protein